MGNLPSDMTRLCGEISALHGARKAFLKDLQDAVSGMQAEFRDAHGAMARKTKTERVAFVSRRVAFVSSLKKTVSGMRTEFVADIAGAHQAWFGKGA